MPEDIDLTDFNVSTTTSRSTTLGPDDTDIHAEAEEVAVELNDTGDESTEEASQVDQAVLESICTASCFRWPFPHFCNRKFISIATFLTLLVTCFTLWPNLASALDSNSSLALAKWTAVKDFLEWCDSQGNRALSEDCVLATKAGLPAPPNFDRKSMHDLPLSNVLVRSLPKLANGRTTKRDALGVQAVFQIKWLLCFATCFAILVVAVSFLRGLGDMQQARQIGPALIQGVRRKDCSTWQTSSLACLIMKADSHSVRRRERPKVDRSFSDPWTKAEPPMWPELARQSQTQTAVTAKVEVKRRTREFWPLGIESYRYANELS